MRGEVVEYGGEGERRRYGGIREVLELGNVIEIERCCYEWFVDEGVREEIIKGLGGDFEIGSRWIGNRG